MLDERNTREHSCSVLGTKKKARHSCLDLDERNNREHSCSVLGSRVVELLNCCKHKCAAGFALLNLPKGKSLGRSKPETNSYAQAHATHCVGILLYPSSAELPNVK